MSLILIEDAGQQDGKHIIKHLYWESHGVYWEKYPLPVGDYILANDRVLDVISRKQKRGIEVKKLDFTGTYSVCVDTKKDMQEICSNICGTTREHERFRDECILAQNTGIKLYVLVENEDGIRSIDDVSRWRNPRINYYEFIKQKQEEGKYLTTRISKKPPTSGETLSKAMLTMQEKYGVSFLFCSKEEAGQRVLELLKGEE